LDAELTQIHVPRGYRPKAQAKILFLLHALLKEIQEYLSSHLSQEFSAINGLRLSTNDRFAPNAVIHTKSAFDLSDGFSRVICVDLPYEHQDSIVRSG
jgi:hypothetical protein